MADTQRTRAQILALFADNTTGQISAQDMRDFIVTLMPSEFVNEVDFWTDPQPKFITTDKTVRGWIIYSQVFGSACSFGNAMCLDTSSGKWIRADVAASVKTGVIGLAYTSYASGDSGNILLRGMIYDSSFSATFSGFIGKPVYLASGAPGSIAITKPTSDLILGFIFNSDVSAPAIGKYYFNPQWAVKGA